MVTASLGTSKVRSPRPSFTYTKTFATLPPSTTMVSAVLVPLQAASWLISILEGFGAEPSSFTVPLTAATVLGSIGVAAGAGCAMDEGAEDCDSFVSSFLLQPTSSQRPRRQSTPNIATDVFFFMMWPFLES